MPTYKKSPALLNSIQAQRYHADALLDEVLSETFPASDPVAITFRKGESNEGGAVSTVAAAGGAPTVSVAATKRMAMEHRVDYWGSRKRSLPVRG